jgi:hypothetical protein
MLQQQQLIGDLAGLALLDELLLKRQPVGVGNDAETPDLESYIHPSSNPSSRSFMKDRNRPASAPSIRR